MIRQTLCGNCHEKHEFETKECLMPYNVKGDSFTIYGEYGLCGNCGHEVSDIKIERHNQHLAFNEYRKKHNLIFVQEIKDTRDKYSLNQKEFSLILGLGEIQVTRYERGTLPTPAHSTLIKQAKDPLNMLNFVTDNGHRVDPTIKERLINQLKGAKEAEDDIVEPIRQMVIQAPNEKNGLVQYNWNKMKSLIAFYAKEQRPHFTKMCKLLFYSDFYHFNEFGRSISGSRYVRMPYGPCPERYETIFESVPGVTVEQCPDSETGRILNLIEPIAEYNFTDQEWQTIKLVNEKFNHTRSKVISDFSHEEKAWLDYSDHEYISYEYARYLDPQRQI